jgi:GMP synthase (glutamine-hydrolysing)
LIHKQKILIVDYGSQYTQLIARRVRELKVYSEIVSCLHDFGKYDFSGVTGIILSGGPASVTQKDAPKLDNRLINKNLPVLGVCYGLQLMALNLGGKIGGSKSREYGRAIMTSYKSDLFGSLPLKSQVWMSHGDHVERPPRGFKKIGSTKSVRFAAIADEDRRLYGVQFHPEVAHTEAGMQILRNFVYIICKCKKTWSTESFIDSSIEDIRKTVGKDGKVICALSGGVDSSVESPAQQGHSKRQCLSIMGFCA